MSLRERYPAIAKVALEIAFDNGGINRFRPEEKQGDELERFLAGRPSEELDAVEPWLAGLSEADIIAVCSGGQDEPETIEIMKSAPPFTNELLDAYFEEVC